jgi:spore germination protein KC
MLTIISRRTITFYRLLNAILLVAMLLLTGCWDIREIDKLGFVTAVGVDRAKAPDKFRVTVQIPDPSSAGSQAD